MGTPTREHSAGGRPWTSRELVELRRLAPMGIRTVAEELGRSVASVRRQAERQRISLRPPGSTEGTILGQPRGTSLRREATYIRGLKQLREDALAGRLDLERMARRVKRLRAGAKLCPECARYPQEVEATGLCLPCHLDRLRLAHAIETDAARGGRELDAERQRKHRARTQAGPAGPTNGDPSRPTTTNERGGESSV